MNHQPGMRGRIRLLPIVAVTIGALGIIKLLGLTLVGGYILQPITPAIAQEAGADPESGSAEATASPDQAEAMGKVKAPQTMAGPEAAAEDIDGRRVVLADKPGDYSKAETAVLESLRKRREALDKRERSLEMQTNLLNVAEKRINEKINEIKSLQAKLDASYKDREKAEDKKLAGLVTMYEAMKPKDAARIFNGLDLPVLLGVARRLNPRKMSPILAKMNAKMAQTITVRIAELNTTQAQATGGTGARELESIAQAPN